MLRLAQAQMEPCTANTRTSPTSPSPPHPPGTARGLRSPLSLTIGKMLHVNEDRTHAQGRRGLRWERERHVEDGDARRRGHIAEGRRDETARSSNEKEQRAARARPGLLTNTVLTYL